MNNKELVALLRLVADRVESSGKVPDSLTPLGYDPEDGWYLVGDLSSDWAERLLDDYRDYCIDGWSSDTDEIQWGIYIPIERAVKIVIADKENFTDEEWDGYGYSPEWDQILDYQLESTWDDKEE